MLYHENILRKNNKLIMELDHANEGVNHAMQQ